MAQAGYFDNAGWWPALQMFVGAISSLINSISQTILVVGLVREHASAPTFFLLCLVQPLVTFFDQDIHGYIDGRRGESTGMLLLKFSLVNSLARGGGIFQPTM